MNARESVERWLERRAKCDKCRHQLRTLQHLRCSVVRVSAAPNMLELWSRKANRQDLMHCIDARSDWGPCGPEARLFEEK